MDTLRCIVVDDEPLAVKMLENFISRTPFLQLEASFTDPVKALSEIQARDVELVFLDIQMPDLDGMELSRMVPPRTRIIFTTAFRQYAFESYEVRALDFLLKPIRYGKFMEAVQRAKQWFDLNEAASARPVQNSQDASPALSPEFIFIKSEGTVHNVQLSDILYISGMKDYVMIYLSSSKVPLVTHLTMKAATDMLPSSSFMRVHKSFIVALDKIQSVEQGSDILVGGRLIHVGDAYRESFDAFLRANMLSKG